MFNGYTIVSQPKLRRVDANILFPTQKSSKEEFMKSQTYQQFMKNMDHEIKRLEESDQPYNIGKQALQTVYPKHF